MSTVVTRDGSLTRYLVEPVLTSPMHTTCHIYSHPTQVSSTHLQTLLKAPLLALDFETKGNDISASDFTAVGVGISNGPLSIYVSLKHCTQIQKQQFLLQFVNSPLLGHNVYFDGGVFYRETGVHARWKYCTLGLYKQLSSESQALRHGLKKAQQEILGWTETNETDLDQWLVDHGYHKENVLIEQKEGWYLKKDTERYYSPLKGEMYRAPDSILGKYCCLDAYSTYLLFTKALEPAMHKIDYRALKNYHHHDFLPEVEILIESQISGIPVDKDAVAQHYQALISGVESTKNDFLQHPLIQPHIEAFKNIKVKEHNSKAPDKWKKPPKLGQAPAQYTKSGKVSKNWQSWKKKQESVESWYDNPANISKNWEKWREQHEELKQAQHFNINSADHLKWLLYEKLQYNPKVFTKSGQPAVDGDAIKTMGEEVQSLKKYKDLFKELGYVEKCINKLRQGKDGIWRIHAQYMVPGTLTGRLSGTGGLNIQQLPKSRGYLECWKPLAKDKVWIDCDWVALEPTVITELTRDEGMMTVYGPGAKNTDIYLYFGSNIPAFRKEFLKHGYDYLNPTPEGIKAAKKACKPLRNICKTVVLAKQYRAGARKIHSTLTLNGVDMSLEEVQDICSIYDETFKRVKQFSYILEREWNENNGWVYNGIGRPMTVAEDQLKDLVNRVCQSTGHDIHMKALRIFRHLLKQANIEYDWIIPDFHDQFLIECKKEDADKIISLISGPLYGILNKELGGLIPIKGDPQIVYNLAEAKLD